MWDFTTEPEFQEKLDWMDSFIRTEIEPLDQVLDEVDMGCFQLHRVRLLRSYLSNDGLRMLCLYRAPDAESERQPARATDDDDASAGA